MVHLSKCKGKEQKNNTTHSLYWRKLKVISSQASLGAVHQICLNYQEILLLKYSYAHSGREKINTLFIQIKFQADELSCHKLVQHMQNPLGPKKNFKTAMFLQFSA